MGDEINNNFTEGQKNAIYKELLMPLKLKISQILLYDTEAALEFLQEYNEIIKNEDSLGNQIIKRIADLEFKMQQYMSKEGKEKAFEERSKAILQSIDDLRNNAIQLSLEDFENEFSKLKRDYEENIENYSFEDRDKIEREIYALQANLIMRQVASGKTADELQQTITEQDKIGLNIFIAEQINLLKQKDGLNDVATKVNNIVMTDSNAVLNPKLWSWLNAAERGIKSDVQSQMIQPAISTAMAVVSKKNNTLADKITRLFSKEPVFPLQISDLKKINIEWLSKYISESMLLELENERLSEENRKVDERYIPDSKVIIYKMFEEENRFAKENDNKYKSGRGAKKSEVLREYQLFLKNKGIITMSIGIRYTYMAGETWLPRYYLSAKAGDYGEMFTFDLGEKKRVQDLIKVLRLSELIDKIFNTDFQQQLLREMKDVYIDRVSEKNTLENNLTHSWFWMNAYYEKTRIEFYATEEAKRKQFYEKNRFKEQLKQIDGISAEGTQKTVLQDQQIADEVNNGEVEQGGK